MQSVACYAHVSEGIQRPLAQDKRQAAPTLERGRNQTIYQRQFMAGSGGRDPPPMRKPSARLSKPIEERGITAIFFTPWRTGATIS
jgi:hypothetical protein